MQACPDPWCAMRVRSAIRQGSEPPPPHAPQAPTASLVSSKDERVE